MHAASHPEGMMATAPESAIRHGPDLDQITLSNCAGSTLSTQVSAGPHATRL
jgi:hypothetical protein